MQTEADLKIEEAKESVQSAIKSLSAIVIDRVHGHDEYQCDYQADIQQSLLDLVAVRDKLR